MPAPVGAVPPSAGAVPPNAGAVPPGARAVPPSAGAMPLSAVQRSDSSMMSWERLIDRLKTAFPQQTR